MNPLFWRAHLRSNAGLVTTDSFRPPHSICSNAACVFGLPFHPFADINFPAMMKLGAGSSLALRLIMLSLMLAVQSLSFAHELSHFQAPDGEYCSICSGQPGNEALVQTETAAQLPQPPLYLATAQPTATSAEGPWPDWQSRAPPARP
jgi:hypothetical protein